MTNVFLTCIFVAKMIVMDIKYSYVYIMANKTRSVLYIGVTSDLFKRIHEHKKHVYKGSFTDKYNVEYCVYYEVFGDINLAIQRETQLKLWSRAKKERLIKSVNQNIDEIADEKHIIKEISPKIIMPKSGR